MKGGSMRVGKSGRIWRHALASLPGPSQRPTGRGSFAEATIYTNAQMLVIFSRVPKSLTERVASCSDVVLRSAFGTSRSGCDAVLP